MPLDPLADPRIFVWPKIPLLLLSLHSLTCGAHTSASPSISFLLQPSPLHGLLTSAPPTPRAPPACSPAGRAPSPRGRAPPPLGLARACCRRRPSRGHTAAAPPGELASPAPPACRSRRRRSAEGMEWGCGSPALRLAAALHASHGPARSPLLPPALRHAARPSRALLHAAQSAAASAPPRCYGAIRSRGGGARPAARLAAAASSAARSAVPAATRSAHGRSRGGPRPLGLLARPRSSPVRCGMRGSEAAGDAGVWAAGDAREEARRRRGASGGGRVGGGEPAEGMQEEAPKVEEEADV